MSNRLSRQFLSMSIALILLVLSTGAYAIQPSVTWTQNPFSPDKLLGRMESSGLISIPGSADAWQAYRYQQTGAIAMAVGKPVNLGAKANDDKSAAETSRMLIPKLPGEFGFAYDGMKVAQILHGKGTITAQVTFSEDEIEIYGAYAALTFNARGQFVSIKGRSFGSKLKGSFSISPTDLAAIILDLPDFRGTFLVSAGNVWFPVLENGEVILYAASQITLTHADPLIRPVVFADASTGEILAAENHVEHEILPGDTRGLYRPFRPGDQPVTGAFPEEVVRLAGGQQIFSDTDGTFSYEVSPGAAPFRITSELRGRWVDVEYEDGADAAFDRQVERIEHVTVGWTPDNSRDDERMLYFHTNFIHSYWKRLDPNFRGMDRVIPATCEYGENYDNAFWNGQGMFFGNGPTLGNLALKGDVIHHEYGHGVTGGIYPRNILPYVGEPGALNEAWSDYFPCSISDEPFMGENALGGAGAMRNLDNNLVYPRDWYGEVHYDSRIISAAMWHSRAILGRNLADTLFHYARYELGANFLAYFTDVLVTDDDDGDITNGTPNDLTLYEQFGRHGIGPGLFPKIVISNLSLSDDQREGARGDGDGFWESGESITADISLQRLGALYPPAAEDVSIWFASDNQWLEVREGANIFGDMRVGDELAYVNHHIFNVLDGAPLGFANITMRISAAGWPEIFLDTLRVTIGTPQLLLVRDEGEGEDRTPWFEDALDFTGAIYCEYSIAQPHVSLDNWLEQVESVIWFTGDAREGFLSDVNRGRIASFIDNGGNFVLTGQSIGRELRGTEFLEDNFGARVVADSVNQFLINGVEGDPVSRGMTLLALGSRGANNQRRPASIEAVGNGVECFRWPRLENTPGAGVRLEHNESGAKTLFLSFGIEGIGGHGRTNTRGDLLLSIIDWLGVEHFVGNEPQLPAHFGVAEPYPNPFNGSVTLPVTLAAFGIIDYVVYDIAGREMTHGFHRAEIGRNLLTINAQSWGSGYYFLNVESGGIKTTRRLLLIR